MFNDVKREDFAMFTTSLFALGCAIGAVAGFYVFKRFNTKTSSSLRLDSWDENSIVRIAEFLKKNRMGVAVVRKKNALKKFERISAEIPQLELLFSGIDGVIVPLNENGDENWTKIIVLLVKNSNIDKWPDLFIVTSDGRFSQVETESKSR